MDSLIALAGTPDDHASIEDRLVIIAQLCAERVAAVSYASVTAKREGAYTTVAASNDIATAVDEAQYAEQAGPCLEALETGTALAVPDIATTLIWPSFRDTAYRLGLRASLSIPLFAGSGVPVAALNLYGRDPATMATLSAAVWAAYDQATDATPNRQVLEPGAAELTDGLSNAFARRTLIQQAIGVIMAQQHATAGRAYVMLRLRAVDAELSLTDVAAAIIAKHNDDAII